MARGNAPYYLQKDRDLKQFADDYNHDWDDYQPEDTGSQEPFDYDRLERDILASAASDFDLRMSTQAAKLGGYEGAEDLPVGYDTMEDLEKGVAFMEGVFYGEELGKTYNGPYGNDAASVTNYLVNYDRDAQNEMFQDLVAEQYLDDDAAANEEEAETAEPYVMSEELKQANTIVDQRVLETLDGRYSNDVFANSGGKPEAQAQNLADVYTIKLSNSLKPDPFSTAYANSWVFGA